MGFNVAAVPDELLESELFGFRKGAFSGATENLPGLFETASGGTLFLDEIAEMSPRAQAKILRALEEKKIRRLDDRSEISIDVRFLAATHQDLRQLVKEGRFREDLFYRLNVVEKPIAPLRERIADLRPLIAHFLKALATEHETDVRTISAGAVARMEAYDWPGNVRELRNALEQAVILANGEVVTEEDLPSQIIPENLPKPGGPADELVEEEGHARIMKALEDNRWNRGKAAEQLGISRRHIYRLMEKFGIQTRD